MDLSRVNSLHVLNDQKFVNAPPATLAQLAWDELLPTINLKAPHVFEMTEAEQTTLALNVYALASCMRSEETGSAAGEFAIGCALRNACTGVETPATKLMRSMIHGVHQSSDSHFGAQEAPGKWACTRLPPTEYTLTQALLLLTDPTVEDVTLGSVFWIGARAQDQRHAQNPALYTKSAADIAAEHARAGYHVVHVPGVPETWFFSRTQYPYP